MCPACNNPWIQHPRSVYVRPTHAAEFLVLRGRCEVRGEAALQKICWVHIDGASSPDAYLKQCAQGSVSVGFCPACGTRLKFHGRFWRKLRKTDGEEIRIPLYRGLCKNADCPVSTVTHYPPFVTPYQRCQTEVREQALRSHEEEHVSWEQAAETAQVSPDSVRRWARDLRLRIPVLYAVLFALLLILDPSGFALTPNLTVWTVADRLAELLDCSAGRPRLALSRALLPPPLRGPPRWPVWA